MLTMVQENIAVILHIMPIKFVESVRIFFCGTQAVKLFLTEATLCRVMDDKKTGLFLVLRHVRTLFSRVCF